MTGGIPAYSQNHFPNDKPPTLFSPASPKAKAEKSTKDLDDGASMASTSTFSSTVGLIKSKLPISYKDYKARKETEASKRQPLKDTKSPRARTAEAFMYVAMSK